MPPTVDAGPDIVVNEGEVVTLVGSFWDVEPGDSHESIWNFGDAQTTERARSPRPMTRTAPTARRRWTMRGATTGCMW